MTRELMELEGRVAKATGNSRSLDQAVAACLAGTPDAFPIPEYTASVDACVALIGEILPDWHWHIGYGPRGIMPYASLSRVTQNNPTTEPKHFEATAPTVPLAILSVIIKAVSIERARLR